MELKDLIGYIDPVTPVKVVDIDSEETLWCSWENNKNDIPNADLLDDCGIYYNKREQVLVLFVISNDR